MKSLMLIFLALLLHTDLLAQKHFVGLKAGPGFFAAKEMAPGWGPHFPRNGIAAGLSYEYETKKFTFGGELLYIPKGYGTYDHNTTDYNGKTDVVWTNREYVSIPLKASYRFGKRLYGKVGAGIAPGFLVQRTVNYPDGRVTTNNKPKEIECASLLDLAVGFRITERWVTEINFGSHRSFFNIHTDNSRINNQSPNIGYCYFLGIKYGLLKKD